MRQAMIDWIKDAYPNIANVDTYPIHWLNDFVDTHYDGGLDQFISDFNWNH